MQTHLENGHGVRRFCSSLQHFRVNFLISALVFTIPHILDRATGVFFSAFSPEWLISSWSLYQLLLYLCLGFMEDGLHGKKGRIKGFTDFLEQTNYLTVSAGVAVLNVVLLIIAIAPTSGRQTSNELYPSANSRQCVEQHSHRANAGHTRPIE